MLKQNFAMHNKGQVLIYVILIMAVLASFVAVLASTLLSSSQTGSTTQSEALAIQIAESGIDKALWCLNHQSECASGYTGESGTIGSGSFTVDVQNAGNSRIITSTATVNGRTKIVEITATNQNSVDASFFYGVQAGIGGIELANNASIDGNVYAMGSVIGSNGSSITGDAILALSNPDQYVVSDPSVSPLNTKNIGTSGSTDDRLAQSFVSDINDKIYSIDLKIAKHANPTSSITMFIYSDAGGAPGTNISGSGQVLNASVPADTVPGWENGWVTQVFAPTTQLVPGATYWLVLEVSSSSGTRYWQVVTSTPGNDTVYPDGTAKLDGDLTSMPAACVGGCDIAFRVNVGGVAPTLKIPTVGANAYARTIESTEVGQKAYYQNIIGTVRANGGADTCIEGEAGPNCFDDQPDQPPQNFPMSESQIVQIEAQAAAGGIINCSPTCEIADGSSIGPKKYVGNVNINGTVTMTGTVWVSGDITIINNAILKLSDGYGNDSGVIIADDPANRTTKGKITLSNNGDLRGNTNPSTYIMAIAMNADPTFATNAISVANNLTAAIIYAANGTVDISNNASLKEVTGQKIRLQNNATIIYESGLANIIFSGGPGGAWGIEPQSWREIE